MFIDIENISDIKVGDVLYFKESYDTSDEWWNYALRVEAIEDDTHVTIMVPDRDTVENLDADEWNEKPNFDGYDTHVEEGCKISRLIMLVNPLSASDELDCFMSELC